MSAQTDTQLKVLTAVVRNELTAYANTKTRNADLLDAIIDSKISYPTSISYVTAIPFDKIMTIVTAHTMTANVTFTANATGVRDRGQSSILLINNVSYTIDLTAFKVVGTADNTLVYTLLQFISVFNGTTYDYICNVINYD